MPRPQAKNTDVLPALRHVVYCHLLALLPPATLPQTIKFVANLALCPAALDAKDAAGRDRELNRVLSRFMNLKVTPDIAEHKAYRGATAGEIEKIFAARYGDRLKDVAGFYFKDRWRLNLPERCFLHAYRSRHGFFTGILCQPIGQIDNYFLLSAAKFGGSKAIRLEHYDRADFEQFNKPAQQRQNANIAA